jgi:hypothetical protein
MYLAYLQLQPAEDTGHAASVSLVGQSHPAWMVQQGTPANVVDVAALKEEIASLRAEVSAMRQQRPRQAESAPARADNQPVGDVRNDPVARAEALRQHQADIEAVDAAFRKQSIDPTWSASTSSTIREVLNSEDVGGLQADNIDCRSEGCRVELHDDGSGRLGKGLPVFAQQLAGSMPTVIADTVPQANGGSTMILYMSRDAGEQQPPR